MNDPPNFTFARLCCLKRQVVRPASVICLIHYSKASRAHFDAHNASNRLERADLSVEATFGEPLSNESLGRATSRSFLAEFSTGRCAPIAGGGFAAFARAAETPPGSRLLHRRSGESTCTNPALRQKTRSAPWKGVSRPISMSAVRIIPTRGCTLAITVFSFEIQELFGLLALPLSRLTAHWQPTSESATCQFEQASSHSPL